MSSFPVRIALDYHPHLPNKFNIKLSTKEEDRGKIGNPLLAAKFTVFQVRQMFKSIQPVEFVQPVISP
jgi:hypothetical protein